MDFAEIKSSLDEFQKNLLEEIVAVYMVDEKGILTREFYRKYGKRRVVDSCKKLGSFFYESNDHQSVSNRFAPSFLGILASPRGEIYEDLLVKYLEYIESLYRAGEDQAWIKGETIEEMFNLTKDEAFGFYRILQRGNLSGNASHHEVNRTWSTEIYREVDDLPEWPSKRDFIHHRATQYYDPEQPVFLADQNKLKAPSYSVLPIHDEASQQFNLMSANRNVFISYSHKDAKFLDQLITHLKPVQRTGLVSAWSDRQIEAGSKWFEQIQTALISAKVAVMMVSPYFLASDFIREHELGPLLQSAEQKGVKILWVLVRACAFKETPLKKYQAIIPPEKPLAQMKAERDAAWVRICDEIKKAANS